MRPRAVRFPAAGESGFASPSFGPFFPGTNARKASFFCSWWRASFNRSASSPEHEFQLVPFRAGCSLRDDIESHLFGLDPVRPGDLFIGDDSVSKLQTIAQ